MPLCITVASRRDPDRAGRWIRLDDHLLGHGTVGKVTFIFCGDLEQVMKDGTRRIWPWVLYTVYVVAPPPVRLGGHVGAVGINLDDL